MKNKADKELKECPFCKKEVAQIQNYANRFKQSEEQYKIVCAASKGGCGSSSPYCFSKEQAIEKWNTRPEPKGEGEMREAIEYALKIKDTWLLDESIALEHEVEAIALAMMYDKFKQALSLKPGKGVDGKYLYRLSTKYYPEYCMGYPKLYEELEEAQRNVWENMAKEISSTLTPVLVELDEGEIKSSIEYDLFTDGYNEPSYHEYGESVAKKIFKTFGARKLVLPEKKEPEYFDDNSMRTKRQGYNLYHTDLLKLNPHLEQQTKEE